MQKSNKTTEFIILHVWRLFLQAKIKITDCCVCRTKYPLIFGKNGALGLSSLSSCVLYMYINLDSNTVWGIWSRTYVAHVWKVFVLRACTIHLNQSDTQMHASFLHNASPGSYPKSSKSSLYRLYNFLRCWGLSCVIWCSILSKEDLSSLLLRIVLVNSGNKVVRFCLMAMYIVSSKESSRWPMTSNFKWQ